jgi:hypothetical protein
MSPVHVPSGSGALAVTIQREGTISLSAGLCQRLGYQSGDWLHLHYIARGPLVILLRRAENAANAFRLSYLSRTAAGESGGKLRSKPFYDRVLRQRVKLPTPRLQPIIPGRWDYDLGVFVEPIDWQRADFSRNGRDALDAGQTGVYRLLNGRDAVVRIGEGDVAARLTDHLGDPALVNAVRAIEWVYVPEKLDAQIIQRLLLEAYVDQYGVLPSFNHRRA